jgi:hypothetical protein
MAEIVPFIRHDGSADFTCAECGSGVLAPIAPQVAYCASCQFASRYGLGKISDLRSARFRREQKE